MMHILTECSGGLKSCHAPISHVCPNCASQALHTCTTALVISNFRMHILLLFCLVTHVCSNINDSDIVMYSLHVKCQGILCQGSITTEMTHVVINLVMHLLDMFLKVCFYQSDTWSCNTYTWPTVVYSARVYHLVVYSFHVSHQMWFMCYCIITPHATLNTSLSEIVINAA